MLAANLFQFFSIRGALGALRNVLLQFTGESTLDERKCEAFLVFPARSHKSKLSQSTHLAQVFQSAEQCRFDGAKRALQSSGNLFQRVLHIKTQIDDLPLLVGKMIETTLQPEITIRG